MSLLQTYRKPFSFQNFSDFFITDVEWWTCTPLGEAMRLREIAIKDALQRRKGYNWQKALLTLLPLLSLFHSTLFSKHNLLWPQRWLKLAEWCKGTKSSGQLLNSSKWLKPRSLAVGLLRGQPLKTEQLATWERPWQRARQNSYISTTWLTRPRAGPKKPLKRAAHMGPGSWLRPFFVDPEHPFKNQARVPTLCVQNTHCGWSKGLSVEDTEAPRKPDPALILQHWIQKHTKTRLYEPGETEGYKWGLCLHLSQPYSSL